MRSLFLCSILLLTMWVQAQNTPTERMNQLLEETVTNGLVDYARVKENAQVLKDYVAVLKTRLEKDGTSKNAMADWINLYNVLTLEVIIIPYPKVSSIRKLKKPWDTPVISIGKRKLTLNDIEHNIIRKQYQDYRIHFALVCASLGCPDLPPWLFTAKNLEKELNLVSAQYLNSPKGTILKNKNLSISALFNWYKKDFKPDVRSVLKKHLEDPSVLKYLKKSPRYLHYSWDLNVQK